VGATLPVRSVLKCKSEFGVCQACYGTFLATGGISEIGDAVGIIAAQSIGEPGTPADDADVPHGRRRRSRHHARSPARGRDLRGAEPEGCAKLSEVSGTVKIEDSDRGRSSRSSSRARRSPSVISCRAGRACSSPTARSSNRAMRSTRLAQPGRPAAPEGGQPHRAVLVQEVQRVYKSQGVDIHDKHIELIVRQMLKKVRVESAGDTDLLPGQLVDKVVLDRENARVKKEKKEQATWEAVDPRDHKSLLATESFLSAASFQETTKC